MKKQYIVVGAILLGLGIGGFTMAQAAVGQLSACVDKKGDTHLIIEGFTKKQTCEKGEQLISWNTMGLPGPAGPQGPKGEKGDTGVQGLAGVAGTQGTQGIQGEIGPMGPQGSQGTQGPKGDAGYVYDPIPPMTVTFAENRPTGFNSDWVEIPPEYTQLLVHLTITENVDTYAIQFTNSTSSDPVVQLDRQCGRVSVCDSPVLPVLGKFYRISMGTSVGDVTALGYLSTPVFAIAGPQGPKGDKGETGESASFGSGNIAFIYGDMLLKTDGTVWAAGANPGNNPPYTRINCTDYSGVTNIPIPISSIKIWQYKSLIDIDGNYWYTTNTCPHNWQNFGPLP